MLQMTRTAAAVDSRYPFWVRNEGYEETLVHDQAEHFALLEERGLPATPPPLPIPAIETPPSSWAEYPKDIAGVIVEDAEEERVARAGDPDDIEGRKADIREYRGRQEAAAAKTVFEETRGIIEFPKWVDSPDGRVIVHSAAEEAAVRRKAAAAVADTIEFRPSAHVKLLLAEATSDGTDASEVINTAVAAWMKWRSSAFKARKTGAKRAA
jgi:hypothetical protein